MEKQRRLANLKNIALLDGKLKYWKDSFDLRDAARNPITA
jgi:hypothetical protein